MTPPREVLRLWVTPRSIDNNPRSYPPPEESFMRHVRMFGCFCGVSYKAVTEEPETFNVNDSTAAFTCPSCFAVVHLRGRLLSVDALFTPADWRKVPLIDGDRDAR